MAIKSLSRSMEMTTPFNRFMSTRSSLMNAGRLSAIGSLSTWKRQVSTIPYDPSLTLGNIVHEDRIKIIEQVSEHQAKIDAAKDKMNSFMSLGRSLDLTRYELVNMQMSTEGLNAKISDVKKNLQKSAEEYGAVCIKEYPKVQQLLAQIRGIQSDVESPIDYNKTQYKSAPISADSIKFDCQYFKFDKNTQTSASMASTISSYVSQSTSGPMGFGSFGSEDSQMSSSAQAQVNHQYSNHDIEGTLVLSARCTHKNALMLAPFILDVDKAMRVWNAVFSTEEDKIKMDAATIMEIAKQEGTKKEKKLKILSGVTYGSSFVGMVHVLRTQDSESTQAMMSMASQMQSQLEVGNWFSHEKGGIGLDESFSASFKNMMSTATVSSHVNLVVMGVIPSIKSNNVESTVKGFTDFSPDKMMDQLATLQNATNDSQKSLGSAAEAARTGGKMTALEGQKIKSAVAAVGELDKEQNQIINVASLMEAFEDYVKQAAEGQAGIPINYYTKDITRAQLAQMWMGKYLPNVGMINISGDDSGGEKASTVGSESKAE